jgi:hypothetical protein
MLAPGRRVLSIVFRAVGLSPPPTLARCPIIRSGVAATTGSTASLRGRAEPHTPRQDMGSSTFSLTSFGGL